MRGSIISSMTKKTIFKGGHKKTMKYKTDKGVAGLTVLLSLIVMLFVIGLLVMIFAIMSGKLQTSTTDATAIQVINDTGQSISSVTDWFDIFIVIGAMVVLILLTVIIITAIRSSGLVATGSA
jgi:hypothetical protein